jgi:hypothetical protein
MNHQRKETMETHNRNEPVKLGERYTDSITGFAGVAVSRHEYLYGCVRVKLEGKSSTGDPKEFYVDEQRLTDVASATSGGPIDAPPSRDP